jgi:hypothetical protein
MSKKKVTADEKAALDTQALQIVPEPKFIQRQVVEWPSLTERGAPKECYVNALKAVDEFGLDCSLDVFHNRYLVNGNAVVGARDGNLTDAVVRRLRFMSFAAFGLDPGKAHMEQALHAKCEAHQFNPVIDMIDACYDQLDYSKNLIDDWLTVYLGVPDTPLVRAQGKIILMAMVKRAYDPGAKFDHVPVLEGPEGVRKSSALKVLANGSHDSLEYFSDSPVLGLDERKQQELTKGVWVYELAELAGMKKADQFAVKNFVTKQEERARPAYGHFDEIQPRTCVFFGTFNTTPGGDLIEYLNPGDQRRWWPLKVGKIDIDALKRDRAQLLAEAKFELDKGGKLYLPPELERQAKGIAVEREKTDPMADRLSPLYSDIMLARERKTAADGSGVIVNRDDGAGCDLLYLANASTPFAMIEEGLVWVSASHVVSLVPQNRQHDGNGVMAAMRQSNWQSVRRYVPGAGRLRGYVHEIAGDVVDPDPVSADLDDYDPAA